mmetsp:Transcript_20992/g.28876  ORF Transcript_20992/g.28876 Transcript_20992/m.28876 type:complete len:463 (+) Transcript_20992:56-1444(+)
MFYNFVGSSLHLGCLLLLLCSALAFQNHAPLRSRRFSAQAASVPSQKPLLGSSVDALGSFQLRGSQSEQSEINGGDDIKGERRASAKRFALATLASVATFALGPAVPTTIREMQRGQPLGQAVTAAVRRENSASAMGVRSITSMSRAEKMATVPVFMVTTGGGWAFRVPAGLDKAPAMDKLRRARGAKDNLTAVLLFFDPDEAMAHAQEMLAANRPGIDASLKVMDLREAWALVNRPEQYSISGQNKRLRYYFCPSWRQLRMAKNEGFEHYKGERRFIRMNRHRALFRWWRGRTYQAKGFEAAKKVMKEQDTWLKAFELVGYEMSNPNAFQVERVGRAAGKFALPVFEVEGLVATIDGKAVRPLFLDGDEVKDAWVDAVYQKMLNGEPYNDGSTKDGEWPYRPGKMQLKVRALNLPDVLVAMAEEPGVWDEYAFVPYKNAVEFAKNADKQETRVVQVHKPCR